MTTVAECALSVALACPPRRRSFEDEMVHFDSNNTALVITNAASVTPDVLTTDSLDVALSKDLAGISEVRHVLAQMTDESLAIWVAIDNPDPQTRRKVYAKELELIGEFPSVNFDFNIVATRGRSVDELVSGARVVYSRAA